MPGIADRPSTFTIRGYIMKKMSLFIVFALAAVLFLGQGAHAASTWPDRTVTMIIPFAAGGTTDVLGRALANSLSEELGQKFIVKNVSGGNGAVGAAEAAQVKPDGYSIAFLPVGPGALMWQQRKIPYDNKSFIPVAQVAANPTALHVRNDTYKTLKDLIGHLKANPGKVAYGSSGAGSQPHIAGMMLLQAAGVTAKHIPNTDGATSVKDLLGGVTEFNMNPVTYVDLNDITALVIFSEERDPKYPNVPSLKEVGVFPEGSELPYTETWIGMFVPKGTPKDVITKLEATIEKIMKDPKFIEVSAKTRQTLKWRNAEDFTKFYDAECAKYNKVLGEAGLLRK